MSSKKAPSDSSKVAERLFMSTILVTGGCGFIGSNFIRYLIEIDSNVHIINFDALTYAGNPDNLADIAGNRRYRFVHADIADRSAVCSALGSLLLT